jgi:hypothetical protein
MEVSGQKGKQHEKRKKSYSAKIIEKLNFH